MNFVYLCDNLDARGTVQSLFSERHQKLWTGLVSGVSMSCFIKTAHPQGSFLFTDFQLTSKVTLSMCKCDSQQGNFSYEV